MPTQKFSLMRLLLFTLLLYPFAAYTQTTFFLPSPNGLLRLNVETKPNLSWQLLLRNKALTNPAPMTMTVEGHGVLGEKTEIKRYVKSSINKVLRPEVRQKGASVPELYNDLVLEFEGGWGVTFRMYNEGMAYRFFTRFNGKVAVMDETYSFSPTNAQNMFFPEEDGFYSHNERIFKQIPAAGLRAGQLASLPALVEMESGVKMLLTETDLQDYPGLWINATGDGKGGLRGVFPKYPKFKVELTNRDIQPTDRELFMAFADGTRNYPWRLFLVAEKDADLLTNQLPWLLAEPSRLKQTDWIRPGKVAWDWWNNLNLYGVDFRAGINTPTYKYFVDFAAANGLEYIILDEGWSETGHLNQINASLDMDELAAYAKGKGVGIILWVTWSSIDRQFELLLPNLKKWDIKGLKIDFMQRDDQEAVKFYWRMAEKCAAHNLLVDFHGAHKPAGLQRTWPNVLSFEGVYGLEQAKWDVKKQIDPEHDVTLPFTRQVAGPMDYTPGAMLNYQQGDWSPSFNRPASMGTRCHELAKYIVFESPLQMLSDSPSNYNREPECLSFLAKVPSVWENTVALDGKVGDYVAVARQAASGLWYIGAMTDWTMRDLRLKTDFLPEGDYEIEIFQDGVNADRCAQDYKRSVTYVKSGNMLRAAMAPGGGFVAILRKL